MSSDLQWVDEAEKVHIQPPIYIPDLPAPPWVRTALGNRQIIPSALLFQEFLNQESSNQRSSNQEEVQSAQTSALDLNNLTLQDSNEEEDDVNPLKVDVKTLSTLCHLEWKAPPKCENSISKYLPHFRRS